MVSCIVSGAQCQYVRIQNLSSLASGVSFKAKGTELYETGLYLVSQSLTAYSALRILSTANANFQIFCSIGLCKFMLTANVKESYTDSLGFWQ